MMVMMMEMTDSTEGNGDKHLILKRARVSVTDTKDFLNRLSECS